MTNDKADVGPNLLPFLKQQSSTMKRNIAQMKKIEKQGESSDYTTLECRLQILESYFKQICHIQTQIERLDETDTNRSDIEEIFISVKMQLVTLMNQMRMTGDREQNILNATQDSKRVYDEK